MATDANHVLGRFVWLILPVLAGRRKFRQNRQRRLIPACLLAQNVHTETLAGRDNEQKTKGLDVRVFEFSSRPRRSKGRRSLMIHSPSVFSPPLSSLTREQCARYFPPSPCPVSFVPIYVRSSSLRNREGRGGRGWRRCRDDGDVEGRKIPAERNISIASFGRFPVDRPMHRHRSAHAEISILLAPYPSRIFPHSRTRREGRVSTESSPRLCPSCISRRRTTPDIHFAALILSCSGSMHD